ncbi:hypothetical protein FHS04_002805 [Mesoflavibacter sabulilitoris]|uniref:Toprim domain-containing protein n=1 Tax=Mesoflavibacter zeaxanthinifaciens subsp. sabulilitoris TaxID=1520893 RepID=A0A2T1NNN6_9FLAO|nr:hypothetical protein [Mesoflavibacter zeaxanthinifaciens]MBB3125261.1 hypothetical protein [Mesoflavibacter zeaxanthinifaciens subsp. sabulilitoris]PSG94496.1 hypothetical protein C7H61_00755 [Mesoflavibacter zeaxanthinifaciens subsp. sabulilitoris]
MTNKLPKFIDYPLKELLRDIDLVDFAEKELGFIETAGKNAKTKRLEKDGIVLLVHYTNSDGSLRPYCFYQNKKGTDKGNLIDLVKNYCHLEDPNQELKSVGYILSKFINLPDNSFVKENKVKAESIAKKTAKPIVPINLNHQNVYPFKKHDFLIYRGLNKDTISHFQNAIVNYSFSGINIKNIAFPLYYNKEVQGFSVRYKASNKIKEGYKKPDKGQKFQGNYLGVWLSSTNFKNFDKIAIGENEIDCMSHFQLDKFKASKTLYLSIGGNMYKRKFEALNNTLDWIQSVNPNLSFHKGHIKSITDNDTLGAYYDISIPINYFNHKHNIQIQYKKFDTPKNHNDSKFYRLDIPDHLDYKDLEKKIDAYNKSIDLLKEDNKYSKYIRKESQNKTPQNIKRYLIPNTKEGHSTISKLFTSTFFKNEMILDKSKSKDWNDDLKLNNKKKNNSLTL